MSNHILTISPSPHIYTSSSVKSIMYGVIIALMPALLVSLYYFGLGALAVVLISVLSCLIFEWLISKYLLKIAPSLTDGSAIITGLLLAFNVPSNLPWWIIVIGSLVSIGIGKMTFGGIGNNPFNPALVGRVFLLISFPVQMTSWPKPMISRLAYTDAITGATPLGALKEGIKNGESMSDVIHNLPSNLEMFLGNMGGSLGEISAIAIIIGGVYMLLRKIITWHIPVSMLVSIFLFSGILYLVNPDVFVNPVFHLVTGGVMLGAVFMATDMVTSPMTKIGMLIFGAGIGIITVIIRDFGAYPEGVSFAILIMNAVVPLLNKIKPKRFGEVKKNG